MKKANKAVLVLALGAVAAIASIPASAGSIFTNGPIDGTFSGWTINEGYSVSDSFTLTQASTVTGADFGAWLFPGDTLNNVGWAIGATPYGASSAEGTAATTGVFDFGNQDGYTVDTESFSIPSLTLDAGTYWFTLLDASTSQGNGAYWDIDNGGSTAFESYYGNVNGILESGSNSESFDINGAAATPEPSSWMLFGTGLIGFATMARRRLKA